MIRELADTETIRAGDLVRFDFRGERGVWDLDISAALYPEETVAARRARFRHESGTLADIMVWGREAHDFGAAHLERDAAHLEARRATEMAAGLRSRATQTRGVSS